MKQAMLTIGLAAMLSAQPPRRGEKNPVQAQSASTMAYSVKDGEQAIEITNVAYELTGNAIPGLPQDQRLILRKMSHTKEVVDEIGMEASTTIQAWPLGVDLKQKPVYALTASGVDPRTVNNQLLVLSRGLEEVEWWSVYKLGNAAHLFDTYTPLASLSIGVETQELRYVGLEVPDDDVKDSRLRAPNVVAVLTYASGDRVTREALITCDKTDLATLLRSFADATRKVTVAEHRLPAAQSSNSIRISITPNYPSAPVEYAITVPIVKDDLDMAHVTAPAGVHIAVWRR